MITGIPKAKTTPSSGVKQDSAKVNYAIPLILITSLFFLWGVANNLNDILIRQFQKAFTLSDFQSGLVQSAFYFGYFTLALPASFIIRRFSYKTGILIGLVLYAVGALLFLPAADARSYNFFLMALFVIASGLAFLETAANPYVAILGSPETASFRLNLAQAFNPIGCVTGIVIGQHLIFSGIDHSAETLKQMNPTALDAYYAAETAAVKMPYLSIGVIVILFAVLIAVIKFPAVKDETDEEATEDTAAENKSVLSRGHFKWAVIAQFFYLGAQVCIWSFLIRYILQTIPGSTDKEAANYLIISLVVFTAGRFIGTALLSKIKDYQLLSSYALICMVLVAVAIVFPGVIGLWALVVTSFFMSIMYPTIFSLGIRDLGNQTKVGASILVMSIIGGALLTAGMGQLSDMVGIAKALVIPLLGFVFVLYYGLKGHKK